MRGRAELRPWLRERDRLRPRTRAECWPTRLALYQDGPDDEFKQHKPCPFVSCKYHLHADVGPDGTLTVVGGDIAHTCVLDICDAHPDGLSREDMATVLRVSEERTRVAERRLERVLRGHGGLDEWRGHTSPESGTEWEAAADG